MARAQAQMPVRIQRSWWPLPVRGGGLTVLVQRGAGLLAVAVTVAFVALILSAREQREDARAVAHSTETVAQIGHVERLALDLESGVRGYVITGEDPFWRRIGRRAGASSPRRASCSRRSATSRRRACSPSACCGRARTTRSSTRTR